MSVPIKQSGVGEKQHMEAARRSIESSQMWRGLGTSWRFPAGFLEGLDLPGLLGKPRYSRWFWGSPLSLSMCKRCPWNVTPSWRGPSCSSPCRRKGSCSQNVGIFRSKTSLMKKKKKED